MSSSAERLTMLFDPDCPLCVRFKSWVARWDEEGAIRFLALDDPTLMQQFPKLDLARARDELTVLNRLGQRFEGIEALRQLTAALPGISALKWVYQLPGVTPALGRVYRVVNRHRDRLCLKCGEKWRPSLKYSRRKRRP